MAINIMCMNSDYKYYFEDSCIRNLNEERIEFDENGKCLTFKKGVSDLYDELEEGYFELQGLKDSNKDMKGDD